MKQYVVKIYGGNIHYCESEEPFILSLSKLNRYTKRLLSMNVPFAIGNHCDNHYALVLR